MRQQDHLIHMANQIARNFAVMGDVDAATATADHIATFWDPRMKAGILTQGEGLSPIAAAAIAILHADAHPPHQTHATEETGGSDAG
ncbi:formate dehydrogenase subunit delta [Sphingomonas sp. G-3-2-10]|uniref:formate dehydrogenase subunit delta n=1 Tax=Sphingomonas sp. G-3-2-10 TaxID=2728838 RepID=UPI00321653B8